MDNIDKHPMHNLQSEQIGELATALAKAQAEIDSAKYDKVNPHFKSKYASYESLREACRHPLAKHGLSLSHAPTMIDGKLAVITQLSHSSGQWQRCCVLIPVEKATPQSIGSAITYGKRYGIGCLVAIASDEDDDGEEAEKTHREPSKPIPAPKLTSSQEDLIIDACEGDIDLLGRIKTSYSVKALRDIPSSEYQTIMKRIHKSKETQSQELAHAKTGS